MLLPTIEVDPAANNKAGEEAVAALLLVATFCEIVKLPVVFTEIMSVELSPLYVLAPKVIEPMVKSPVLIKLSAPMPVADAMLRMLFEALVRVTLPAPPSTKLPAVTAAVCVTAPEANKLKSLLAAVSAALIAMFPA